MSDPYQNSLQHPVPARASKVISNTASHSGLNASKVQVLTATVLTSITAPRKSGVQNLIGLTLPAGSEIAGPVTQIQLASGAVECHESY